MSSPLTRKGPPLRRDYITSRKQTPSGAAEATVQEEDHKRGGYSQAGRRSLTITRIGQRPHTYKHDMIMTWVQLMKYFFSFFHGCGFPWPVQYPLKFPASKEPYLAFVGLLKVVLSPKHEGWRCCASLTPAAFHKARRPAMIICSVASHPC